MGDGARVPNALTIDALTFTDDELRLLTLAGTVVLAARKGAADSARASMVGLDEHGGTAALGAVLMRIASHMELVELTGGLDG